MRRRLRNDEGWWILGGLLGSLLGILFLVFGALCLIVAVMI